MTVPLLEADAVTVRIDGRMLLDDVSLVLHAGEVLVLVGPNGAGKSTLLGVLVGDIRPDAGVARIQGDPVRTLRHRMLARRRAVLLQSNEVAFGFTAEQVVEMGRMPWRGEPAEAEDAEAVDAALQDADIRHLRDRRVPTLSGGERARVAYARTLAQRTPILVLDEPTAALDIRHQESVLRRARDHARAGGGVIVVLHDLTLASAYADRIAVLDGGRLVACDVPAAALTAELLTRVYRHPIEVRPGPSGRPWIAPVREWSQEFEPSAPLHAPRTEGVSA
jgi:iron complex transport system ATP-binding protein